MNTLLKVVFLSLIATVSWAQTWVKVSYDTGPGTPTQQLDAVLRMPAQDTANGQALLILHHGGGFSFNTTQQYGEFFSKHGFVTLELKMFNEHKDEPIPLITRGQMMGGLKHLSQMPGVKTVSAMGMSLGAFLTLDASTAWFYEHYQSGGLKFHKLAALYPVCWFYTEAAKANATDLRPLAGLPVDYFQRSAAIPLLILAAGKDSYDGLDADACPRFVKSMPDAKQSEMTQVEVFPEATHGWDHGRTYSFPVRGGCKGRSNCMNHIVSSPATVEQGKHRLLAFLTR